MAPSERTPPPKKSSVAATPGGDSVTAPQDVEHGSDAGAQSAPQDADSAVTRPQDIEGGSSREPQPDHAARTEPSDVDFSDGSDGSSTQGS